MSLKATPSASEQNLNFAVVGLDDVADTLAESQILETADLGTTLVHKVKHPTRGKLLIINTTGSKHIVLPV